MPSDNPRAEPSQTGASVPSMGMRLTAAQRDAVERAGRHQQRHIIANPRTVTVLLDHGLAHIGCYGWGMDGAIYGPILGPCEGTSVCARCVTVWTGDVPVCPECGASTDAR